MSGDAEKFVLGLVDSRQLLYVPAFENCRFKVDPEPAECLDVDLINALPSSAEKQDRSRSVVELEHDDESVRWPVSQVDLAEVMFPVAASQWKTVATCNFPS